MIDFRYHIVSLVAVFLALTLGILLGSSVIQGAVVDRLRDDITRYREERDEARVELRELRDDSENRAQLLQNETAPWALAGRLDGQRVVLVSDGGDVPEWRSHVQQAITAAGAVVSGTISLTDRWALTATEDREALERAVAPVAVTAVTAEGVLGELGASFLEPAGRVLIDALEEGGFLEIQGRPEEGAWPPPSAQVVVLSPARRAELSPVAGSVEFATSVSGVAPTLVASDRPQGRSLVTELRRVRGDEDLPTGLATFDSATDGGDPGGVGVVAALVAAGEGRGGDFGAEGSSFVAPPPTAQTEE